MLAGAASVTLLGRNMVFTSGNLAADLLANALMLQGLGIGHNLNGPSWSISTEFAAYLCFPALVAVAFHRRGAVAAGAFLACVALLCLLAASQPRLGLGAKGAGLMLLRVDLPAVLLFPLLIAALAANEERASGSSRATRRLSHPWLHFLGVMSFSTYLLHQLFRPTESALLRAMHPVSPGHARRPPVCLAESFSVLPSAWLAYHGIERPGRMLVQRAFARRAAPAARPLVTGRA